MGQMAYSEASDRTAVRLAELLGGISLAGDLANGFPAGKVLRTALLSAELARRAGSGAEVARQAYYIALIRFLGCTAFAHEEAHRYGAGDDIAVRYTMAFADPAAPLATLGRVVQGVGRKAPLLARAQAITRLLGDGRAMLEHARAQCDASLYLARTFGLANGINAVVAAICERWDGAGAPSALAGEAIPLAARVFHVADVFELSLARGDLEAAVGEMIRRAGGHIDPTIAALASRDARELSGLVAADDLWERFLAAEPGEMLVVSAARLEEIAAAMGRMADLKSIFMLGHSGGVAAKAAVLSERLGLGAEDGRELRLAAFLHDIGRIGISNRIWDKPGPLSTLERDEVELHPLYTERILRRSPFLAPLSGLAAGAAERLDGSGYHRRLSDVALDLSARILAVADIAEALGEDRPYRPAHSAGDVARILGDEVRAGRLDGRVVTAFLDGGEAGLPARRPNDLSERELEVLCWVARGKTNPEIGVLLGISAKTVQHHVAHIYDKVGVSSRAGAALFAMEKGLLRDGGR